MRFFVPFALATFAMLDSSLALFDARIRTTVGVYANAWDERTSGDGCSPDGCTADLTMDGNFSEESRWSCAAYLENENCEICYTFAEPQDIVQLCVAFWKGDQRVRKLFVTAHSHDDDRTTTYNIESGGYTEFLEEFPLYSDETYKLCLAADDLGDNEWLSLLEVVSLVE